MKKILIAFSALVCVFAFGSAFAAEEASATFKASCQGCHGADGKRIPATGVTPIAGHNSADLVKMLKGYKAGTFGGADKQVMEGMVKHMPDEQLESMADYVSKL